MKDRDVLAARAVELGYKRERIAKHSEIFRHGVTGATVAIAKTPSDSRAVKNAMAALERGAITNGTGYLKLASSISSDTTLAHAIAAVLRESHVPMQLHELIDVVSSKRGNTEMSIRQETSRVAMPDNVKKYNVVRLHHGWYVHDEELARLPIDTRAAVCREIVKIGARRAYRDESLRRRAFRNAGVIITPPVRVAAVQQMIEQKTVPPPVAAVPDAAPPPVVPVPVAVAPAVTAPGVGPPVTARPANDRPVTKPAQPVGQVFELVAQEPDDGTAVLRDTTGALWVARRIR